MDRLLSIGELAELKAVSVDTIRRWEREGKIESIRTSGGHRRYKLTDFSPKKEGKTICYARVSSNDQKADLDRQDAALSVYCSSNGWDFEVIRDFGSGMNYQKKGLSRLLNSLLEGNTARLVVSHKDRLLRFGAELIFAVCEHHGVEVVILNGREDVALEEDLASDVLEIVAVFSARLYGARSHKNKKLVENLAKSMEAS